MIDVSGSMSYYWKSLLLEWNNYIAPSLNGRTQLFGFGTIITLKRSEPIIKNSDFDCSNKTDLITALKTITYEIMYSDETFIRIFLITDGNHNATTIDPSTIIANMKISEGKLCEFFLLGIGNAFPVQYSIDIRSHLHNANANLPSLFWIKDISLMKENMESISNIISNGITENIEISRKGFLLPGGIAKTIFFIHEWVYFPNEIITSIDIMCKNRYQLSLKYKNIPLTKLIEVFRQWNSLIIQLFSTKQEIPSTILPLMERILNTMKEENELNKYTGSIRDRIEQKDYKTQVMSLRILLQKIKTILTTKKFQNEMDLADLVLSTTVKAKKYEIKCLQLKGHTDKDYEKDSIDFLDIYRKHQHVLKSIIDINDYFCRITGGSTISDLQDNDLELLLTLNKFEFLKQFTITGIAVYAPNRNSITINPWSLGIKKVLLGIYSILSQSALEFIADNSQTHGKSKLVQIEYANSDICCNAIIPIIPQHACKIMRPIIRSRLYAMAATFSILKNPHIIDFNVHMAGLGVLWLKIITDHPIKRSEFIQKYIADIIATAQCYLTRYMKYFELLNSNVNQALMTESIVEIEGKTMKCESLIKPIFLIFLQQSESPVEMSKLINIVKMIVLEFIGRCLTYYKNSTPFTYFFADTMINENYKKTFLHKYITETQIQTYSLLDKCYTLEEVEKKTKKIFQDQDIIIKNLFQKIPIQLNMDKIKQLYNITLAGDISWNTLQIFALEIDIPTNIVNSIFAENDISMYVFHSLKYKTSRERLNTNIEIDFKKDLMICIYKEMKSVLYKDFISTVIDCNKKYWLENYIEAHKITVMPMTKQQIINEVLRLKLDLNVTEDNFDDIYNYRKNVGLLSNACQNKECSFFLMPYKNYNQHLYVARQITDKYPHCLHKATFECKNDSVATILQTFETLHGSFEVIAPFLSDVQMLKDIYTSKIF
uniref:VWFA domain-containing protein n=1 Tax=Faxonius propinquus nudivirus TaxID=3139431 RepID=A0AAU8GEB2_9VIRU